MRDRLLGRQTDDVDLASTATPRAAARALARAGRGTAFPLSEAWGAWRVIGPRPRLAGRPARAGRRRRWTPISRARDFTVNAMAEPLAGGELVDPHGGRADLAARRLRMVGERAFEDDPLRVLRLARLACELEPRARAGDGRRRARRSAGRLRDVGRRARLRRAQAHRRRAARRSPGWR